MSAPGRGEAVQRRAGVPDPEASVILVSFNTREKLLSALDHLSARPDPRLEVVVVDNASTDGSAAAARDHPTRPRVLERAENGGFAAGVNTGLEAARGRFIILLNSDAFVAPGAIQRLIEYLVAHPEVGVVGGNILNPDGSHQPTAFSEPTPFTSWREFGLFSGLKACPNRTGPVPWVSGALMAFPRSLVTRIGLMDERFFLYAEDADWCRRVRAAGLEVHYLAEAGAVHEGRGSDPSARHWSPRAVDARLIFHRKYQGVAAARTLRAALTVNWLAGTLLALPVALLPGGIGRRARRIVPTLLHLVTRAGHSRPKNLKVAMVAIVDFPNGVGGDTRRVHMLARSLVAAGAETTLVIPCPRGLVIDEHSGRREEMIEGIHVLRLGRRGSYGHAADLGAGGMLRLFVLRWTSLFRTLVTLARLRGRGYDRFHLYQPTFYDGAACWILARLSGARLAADYCDLSFVDHDRIRRNAGRRLWALNYRWGMTWLPRRLDRVFVISRYLEQMMRDSVPPDHLIRIPPVVDAAQFDVEPPPGWLEERCGVGAGRVVLYAGSFFDNEGVPALLEAVPRVRDHVPEVRFVIAGGHPAEALEELKRRAAALDVGGAVVFPGILPSLEMPWLFRAAEVLVAPKADSVLNRAGVPTKLVEYLASGRPVVASAVGDIPDIVVNGEEALLVPPGDPAALAGAIVALLKDPERARRIGAAGRARVRRDFDVGVIGMRLRRALESA